MEKLKPSPAFRERDVKPYFLINYATLDGPMISGGSIKEKY
jgi:hypothetical protein